MQETLFVSTTPGLEGVLLAEAQALGEARPIVGGVELKGPAGLHRRANLALRTASRVLLEVGTLRVRNVADLRAKLSGLGLAAYLSPRTALEVEAVARGDWAERDLKAAAGGLGRGGATLRLRADGDSVQVSVDTSGELLYRRGYRQEGSRAPLRETLAAGLLALAAHQPAEPLWDPLCGSGTLLIEAALAARGLAPGLQRRFAFEGFPSHDPTAYAREQEELRAGAKAAAPAPIWGSDLNAGALGTARRNGQRAHVLADLNLVRHDATVPIPGLPAGALAIANLPYGKRIGEEADLPKLYRGVAKAVARSGAARLALLFADPRAPEWLGFPQVDLHPVDNGGIRTQLLVTRL